MPCFKRSILAAMLIAFSMLLPSVGFAATNTCQCFCGSEGAGATDENKKTPEACKTACLEDGRQYVGCFTDSTSYPVENEICWTEEECDGYSEEHTFGETTRGEWGTTMPAVCMKTASGKEMRYCYAEPVKVSLNVAIGALTEVDSFPEYVNAIYTWLLPAASLVAVVVMMIGGLQYMLSRGKSKYIDKAKERITNAITGIVILLSIFVLLNLIDPRLTTFETLRLPLIKQVVVIDQNATCEALRDQYGYGVDGSGTCGQTGKISSIDNVKENVLATWKVGDVCKWSACTEGTGYSCLSSGTCARCENLPNASSGTCAALESVSVGATETPRYCRYSAENSSCMAAEMGYGTGYFNCTELRVAASGDAFPGCRAYATLHVAYEGMTASINSETGSSLLNAVCTQDPCLLANLVGKTRCGYSTGSATLSTTEALFSGGEAPTTYTCESY